MVLEPSHLVAPPAGYGPVVDALGLVGDHEVLAYADDLAEASAGGTGPQRAVEAEHILVRTAEGHPVELEAVHEGAELAVAPDQHRAFAAGEGGVRRCEHTCAQVRIGLAAGEFHTVDEQVEVLREIPGLGTLHHVLDAVGRTVGEEAGISLLLEPEHQLDLVLASLPADVGEKIHDVRLAVEYVRHHVPDAVALDLLPAYGREGATDAGVHKPEIVVDLGCGGHGGTGVADVDFLLYGDGRRHAVDRVDVRLAHPPEELPGVRG